MIILVISNDENFLVFSLLVSKAFTFSTDKSEIKKNLISFQVKVFGRKTKETTWVSYFIKLTKRPSFYVNENHLANI